MRTGSSAAVLATALALTLVVPLEAQEWRASAQFGQVSYDGVPASAAATSAVVLSLARSDIREWLGVSAAVPLDADDPFWGVLAGWRRFETRGSAGALFDVTAHGFLQRQSDTTSLGSRGPLPPPLGGGGTARQRHIMGSGIGGEALAGGFMTAGPLRIEVRGGAAAQRSVLAGAAHQRTLPTADARATIVNLPLVASVETRGWWADEATHTYAGGMLQLLQGPVQLWGSAGHWLDGGSAALPWAAGASLAIGERAALEFGARGNAFDPLYGAAPATSFSAGASVRVGGRSAAVRPPVPARYDDGRAVIRIPAAETPGVAPSIAGDFTGWQPVRMQRDGAYWSHIAALEPGVYRYAFVTADGTWFVPESLPGRQDDGMGGHVAVLVVDASR